MTCPILSRTGSPTVAGPGKCRFVFTRRGWFGEGKRASGYAPPVIGTLLASTAIEHDLYLDTRNVKDTGPSGGRVRSME